MSHVICNPRSSNQPADAGRSPFHSAFRTPHSAFESIRNDDVPRRNFLWQLGGGLGGIALASLLGREQLLAGSASQPHAEYAGGLHHRAKARRVVQFYMSGAASQCDTFD
ncbi:MAG: hypothetical protein WD648_02665, partial [Planctomycetaceae bacterium]